MNKDYFIVIDSEKVPVSEEVYRAFKRPAWAERKRRQVRADHELSLEAFVGDGFDIPSGDPLVDEIVADQLLLDMLMSALDNLTDDERALIDGVYFGDHSLREYARQTGANHTSVIRQHNRILDKLRDILKIYL